MGITACAPPVMRMRTRRWRSYWHRHERGRRRFRRMSGTGRAITDAIAAASDNSRTMEPFRTSTDRGERAAIREAAHCLHLEGSGRNSPARLIGQLCDERLTADELVTQNKTQPVLCARVLKVA